MAHGAGSDMHADTLTTVADALAGAGIPCLRFNYPYREAGRRAPDRAPVLEAATREAARELARRTGLPGERLVLGGRSMGGRYCSLVVGADSEPVPALGLALLGYPLHPPGKPERLRVEHFPRLSVPVLFVSGTRDALAGEEALKREAPAIPGKVSFHWLDTADHGFRPLKSSGLTREDVLADVAATVTRFVVGLPS
ncbi:MAG: dienelactone hydrolase [Actinobacteria bacterium]|nr:dienelactone hydrolase [Actinomycetota bacterium]